MASKHALLIGVSSYGEGLTPIPSARLDVEALAEVLRGYSGDRTAALRPFELATVRLRNMAEVLANWRTYVPRDDFLTQRGGTFLLEADDTLLYSYRDRGMLGFSATMARPLSFLDPYLGAP
jgi:hypothetical protein